MIFKKFSEMKKHKKTTKGAQSEHTNDSSVPKASRDDTWSISGGHIRGVMCTT